MPQFVADITRQQNEWAKRRAAAERRRALAEKRIEQCGKHLGSYRIVEQIAALLAPAFPDYILDVLGPFGLMHEVSIHVYRCDGCDGLSQYQRRGGRNVAGSLAFRGASDHQVALIDYDNPIPSSRYPDNSIGAMNGMNYPSKPLPATIEEIAVLLQNSIDQKGANTDGA